MSETRKPKLVVCDLDQLLHNRDAESALLDTWMSWERGHRPLLIFHSARTIEEIQRLLPSSVLPPADFLIGGSTGMLVRHSFWNRDLQDDRRAQLAGFQPEHLLASMASQARADLKTSSEDNSSSVPMVENAVLTMAGLSVTFASKAKKGKLASPNAPLAWLFSQLRFNAGDIQTYVSTPQALHRSRKAAAR